MTPIALFTLAIAGVLIQAWGLYWDISWHIEFGERALFVPPHITLWLGLLLDTIAGWLDFKGVRRSAWPRSRMPLLPLGALVQIGGYLLDFLWHYLFGPDLELGVWSLPHFLIASGVLIELAGCLAILTNSANELYPRARSLAPLVVVASMLTVSSIYLGPLEYRATHRSLLLYPIFMGFVASAVLRAASRFLSVRWVAVRVAMIYLATRGVPTLFLWLVGSAVPGYPPFLVVPALLMDLVDLVMRPGRKEIAGTAIAGALFGACFAVVEYFPTRIASQYPWPPQALWAVAPFAAGAGLYGALCGHLVGNLLSRSSLVTSPPRVQAW